MAYVENDERGELIEEDARVERLQRTFDAVRDLTQPPPESGEFIIKMWEDASCEP